MERRSVPTEFEVRAKEGRTFFYGYALLWGTRSQNLGGFREEAAQGATSDSIKNDDIRALKNHDANLILGRNTAGTLRMAEDTTGLHYEVDIPDTSYARDLVVSMERGDITQSSFGFRARRPDGDEWMEDEDGLPLRVLRNIQLFDVSPVTYPAYVDSTSGVQSRAVELLAERRGLSPSALADEAALLAAIRGPQADEVIAGFRPLSTRSDFLDRTTAAFALAERAARLSSGL